MVHELLWSLQAKRHMVVQHTALQYMVDMWKFSSQPVVSDALRLGRASIVPQSATAWSQQRRQQRVHGEFLESSVDIRVDRLTLLHSRVPGLRGTDKATSQTRVLRRHARGSCASVVPQAGWI